MVTIRRRGAVGRVVLVLLLVLGLATACGGDANGDGAALEPAEAPEPPEPPAGEPRETLADWITAPEDTVPGRVERAVVAAIEAIGAETSDIPPLPRLQALAIEPAAAAGDAAEKVTVKLALNAESALDVTGFTQAQYRRSIELYRVLREVDVIERIELYWLRKERPLLVMTALRDDLAGLDLDDPLLVIDLPEHLAGEWRYWQP